MLTTLIQGLFIQVLFYRDTKNAYFDHDIMLNVYIMTIGNISL